MATGATPEVAEAMKRLWGRVLPRPGIAAFLDLEVTFLDEGRARFSMAVDERHHNPMGTLHGGILTDVADAAMGFATASTLKPPETFTTLELKMSFLRPVLAGLIEADAHIVRRGRRFAFAEADVTHAGKLVARATSTCAILQNADSHALSA